MYFSFSYTSISVLCTGGQFIIKAIMQDHAGTETPHPTIADNPQTIRETTITEPIHNKGFSPRKNRKLKVCFKITFTMNPKTKIPTIVITRFISFWSSNDFLSYAGPKNLAKRRSASRRRFEQPVSAFIHGIPNTQGVANGGPPRR